MKKVLFILICILLFTACGKKEENNKKENYNHDEKKEFTELTGYTKVKINCDPIKDVADISRYQSLFITKSGELYQISYDKVFSNETNCKKVESDKSFTRFIKGGIIDSENNIYYFNDDDKLVLYKESIGSIIIPNDMLHNISKDKYKNIIYSEEDERYGENNLFYFYFNESEKKVYSYKKDMKSLNSEPILTLKDDEEVEYFTYGGIKTNKSYYIYERKIINKEECEKYADVKCIKKQGFYELEDKNIKDQYDNIKYMMFYEDAYSYHIVDKNNNYYTSVLGG